MFGQNTIKNFKDNNVSVGKRHKILLEGNCIIYVIQIMFWSQTRLRRV